MIRIGISLFLHTAQSGKLPVPGYLCTFNASTGVLYVHSLVTIIVLVKVSGSSLCYGLVEPY